MDKNEQSFWDLVAGKLHGELSPEEITRLEQEIADSAKQRLFDKGAHIHHDLKDAWQLRYANKSASWETIETAVSRARIYRISGAILKYAAILLVAFLSGVYVHSLFSPKDNGVQYAEMEVMYGQTGHLFLFDGTEVWLNSGTKLKYPNKFNQNERDVFIEGEAFFKVKPNKKLPFKVKTGKLEVQVLGTSFNVTAYPTEDKQSVFLVEGSVQINNTQGCKIGEITPGQMAVKANDSPDIQVQNADPYFYTSWKNGKIIFNAEKLSDIAQKMERWFNVEIRFDQESLKDYNFSGTILRNKPIDQTIMAMEQLAPIRFQYTVRPNEKNLILIKSK